MIIDLANRILQENGLPKIDFQVSNISLESVTLEGIRIGNEGALKIPRISAVFTWRELIDGEVGEIAIENLELTVRQKDQGLSFGELDAFVYGTSTATDGDSAFGSLNWPFRKLSLGNARVALIKDDAQNNATMVALTIDGTVRRGDSGGLEIGPAKISATSPEVTLGATVAATVTGEGKLVATLGLDHGKASLKGYEITAEEGGLSIDTPLDDLSLLRAIAHLRVSEVDLPFGIATAGSLALSIDQKQLNSVLLVTDERHGLKATLDITTSLVEPLAVQPVAVELVLTASDAERLPANLLPVPVTHGAAELHLTLQDKIGNLQSLTDVQGFVSMAEHFPDLTVAVKGDDIQSPLLPGRLDITVRMHSAHTQTGAIGLYVPEGLHASFIPEDIERWKALLGPLSRVGEITPLRVSVDASDQKPLVTLSPGEILQKSQITGVVRLDGGGLPTLKAVAAASTIVDPHAGIFDATVERMQIQLAEVSVSPYDFSNVDLDIAATVTEAGASGTAELNASVSGGHRQSLYIPNGTIRLPVSWQLQKSAAVVSVAQCADFHSPELTSGEYAVDLRAVRLCLRQTDDDFLSVAWDDNGEILSADLNARLSLLGRTVTVTGQDGWRARLGGKKNEAHIAARWNAAGKIGIASALTLDAITLPNSLMHLSGLELTATSESIDKALNLALKASLDDLQDPRRFPALDLIVESQMANRDAITATGEIAAQEAPLAMEWEAEHTLSTQRGRATLRILPFEFGFGVNELSDLTSALKGIVARPAGQLLGAASASWANGEGCGNGDLLIRGASAVLPDSASVPIQGEVTMGQFGVTAKICAGSDGIRDQVGQVLLDNLAFDGNQVSAKAVNANIDVVSFFPLTTAPDQTLSVGVVDLGFPLTDGVAVFDVTATSRFDLDSLAFNWAGGKVSVAPFQITPDRPLQAIELAVEGAQLTKLTDLVPDKGISGDGVLDGKLPIRLNEDGPAVEKGYLTARGPGVLRYQRELEEGDTPTTVDDMMSNLQYSKLRMDVDGGLSGGVNIGLHVEGTNPDYLDGYPVVLDVNVKGPLGAIMNDGLATYEVPSQILERMRRFGQIK